MAPSAGPAATPTPTPPASPSPAPPAVDPADAFVAVVSAPDFRARIAISGRAKVGRVTTTASGALDVDAGSRHLVLTQRTARSSSTVETISTGGTRYLKTDGVWVATGAPATGALVATLAAASTVTTVGVEDRNGLTLTHLAIAPAGVVPAEIRPGGRITRLKVTIDAWVEDDGTPVLVTVGARWREKLRKTTVAGTNTADFVFTDVGGPIAVAAPTDLWAFNASRRYAYRMAYPVDWQLQKGTAKFADSYYGFGGAAVYAASGRSLGLSLARISNALTKYLPGIKGVKRLKIDRTRPARLGPLPARLIEFHYTYKGRHYWSVAYLAVKGGLVYLVSYETRATTTDADRDMAARFARTFSPT